MTGKLGNRGGGPSDQASDHAASHQISRRAWMQGVTGTVAGAGAMGAVSSGLGAWGGLAALGETPVANQLKKKQRSVILLWLAGGASQLETWDPKPGRPTGGPYAAIPTAVPGVHISELMPEMAKRIGHTCIVRSLNTRNGDHGGGAQLMMRGRRDEATLKYPDMGSILAKELARADSKVPEYVSLYTAAEGRDLRSHGPGFLGSRWAPVALSESMTPPNTARPADMDPQDHLDRSVLRDSLSNRFLYGRRTGPAGSHAEAYSRVHGLMSSTSLFDISKEPQAVRDRYGPTLFGQQALMARRMVEAGVPFVRVARAWWDSHGQNFETHAEMVPELDHVMATLVDDLKSRGMLDNVLIVTLAEFGRTPKINASLGRDHFASAWSSSLTGCGVKGGSVWGKTDKDGERVAEGEVGAGELFATILKAVGIDPDAEYHIGARPIPLVNPGIKAIDAVLA